MEEKKKLKEFLEEKRRKWKEKEELEFSLLHNEAEIWKYINKTRGKKEWIENEISKER